MDQDLSAQMECIQTCCTVYINRDHREVCVVFLHVNRLQFISKEMYAKHSVFECNLSFHHELLKVTICISIFRLIQQIVPQPTATKHLQLCWFIQPTTEQFAWLWVTTFRITAIVPLDTSNFTSGMNARLSDVSYHRTEEFCLCKWLLLLHNGRSWIWTACRSAVLPVAGLQRPCRTHLLSSFWELAGSGRTSLYM